jgi:hypothetical protein
MSQINLLDSETKTSFRVNTYAWLSKAMAGLLVLVLLAYGVLYFMQNSRQKQVNEVRKKTIAAQKELVESTDRKELVTRQGQLNSLNPLLENHFYWSGLLPELARISLRQSTYVNIDAAGDGSIILNVKMPSYADLDKFLQVFDLPEYNRQFSNVRVLSINKEISAESQIAYAMRVQLNFNTDFIKNANP